MQNKDAKKVSCLMVTADRLDLMKRSIQCYLKQTYPNKELVIIDDGIQDLSEALSMVPKNELVYEKLDNDLNLSLGALRNISLEKATGEYLAQWDDDDWFHPDRLSIQISLLDEGFDACCMSAAMMHVQDEPFMHRPYIGMLKDGVPGSIIHKVNNDIRYPLERKGEDTVYLDEWMKLNYSKLPKEFYYLFIRHFHGNNTWGVDHFLRRLQNNNFLYMRYFMHKFLFGNPFRLSIFKLHKKGKEAFQSYFNSSLSLGLFN